MGPAHQDSLAQRRDAYRVTGSGIAKVEIEAVAAVEQIAGGDDIAAQLPIRLANEVEVVGRLRNKAGNAAKLHCAAPGNWNVKEAPLRWVRRVGGQRAGSRASVADGVRSKLVPGLQGGAAREAAIEFRQSGGSWRGGIAGDRIDGVDDLLIETAEEKQLVLGDGAADGKPTELVIEVWSLGKVLATHKGKVLLLVGHGIQCGVVLTLVQAAMPVVGP